MKTVRKILFLPLLCLAVLFACREIELVVPTEYELLPGVPIAPDARPAGMYLLNEANMGSNKSSIDYVDFRNAYYVRNIYAERNPEVVKELGDVGNDIQIYGNKLYAVINCSHKVEVMDVRTCKRIGTSPTAATSALPRGKPTSRPTWVPWPSTRTPSWGPYMKWTRLRLPSRAR